MKDKFGIKGVWKFETIDRATGQVKETWEHENLIVTAGKNRIAAMMIGASVLTWGYLAIGTDNTPEVIGNTALGAELDRKVATISNLNNTFTLVYTFTFGGSYSIVEAGCFDQLLPGGSTMLNRLTFTAKNVDILTSLRVTLVVTIN